MIGDKSVESIHLKQDTKTDLLAKKESLLKKSSFSHLVSSEIASTSIVLDVFFTAESAREHRPNPDYQTPCPASMFICRRSDSSVTCGYTSASLFSQSWSSEPTPSKFRRKTVLHCVNKVFASVQSNSCLLSSENNNNYFVFGMR